MEIYPFTKMVSNNSVKENGKKLSPNYQQNLTFSDSPNLGITMFKIVIWGRKLSVFMVEEVNRWFLCQKFYLTAIV